MIVPSGGQKLEQLWAVSTISRSSIGGSEIPTFVCHIVSVDRVRVANMCPFLATLMAMMSPCRSSSTDCVDVLFFRVFVPSSPSDSFISRLFGVGGSSPVPGNRSLSGPPFFCVASRPSSETIVRSDLVCFVAANTEGDEIGQYVMALYRRLMAASARGHLTAG